jgi:hypothetical protein
VKVACSESGSSLSSLEGEMIVPLSRRSPQAEGMSIRLRFTFGALFLPRLYALAMISLTLRVNESDVKGFCRKGVSASKMPW